MSRQTLYDDRRKSRDDYITTDYYYSRSGPRRSGDLGVVTKDHYDNSPSREVARFDDRDRDSDYDYYDNNDRDGDHRRHHHHHKRQRSLSPSQLRRDRSVSYQYKEPVKHHTAKDVAATVLGAVVGGQAARKASDGNKLAAVAGVLLGAWGGHELEKTWEHHEIKEKARRQSSSYYSR